MKNLKYHIFRVYDYKGGELRTSLNLLKQDFIGEILEDFIIQAKNKNIIIHEHEETFFSFIQR